MTMPPDYAPPNCAMVPIVRAERMARFRQRRGFAWGLAAGLIVGFAAGAAFGDTVSISGTPVTLQATTEPGAVAEVVMHNVSLNGPKDNGAYPLHWSGIDVTAMFAWEADPVTGADGITVYAPGYICDPPDCTMIVPEGQSGRVLLIEWSGM